MDTSDQQTNDVQIETTINNIDNIDNNNNEDGRNSVDDGNKEEEEKLFDGSTHSFAIYYHQTKDMNQCIIAMFIIIIQMVLYGITAEDVIDNLNDSNFTVPVTVRFGQQCNSEDAFFCLVVCIQNLLEIFSTYF